MIKYKLILLTLIVGGMFLSCDDKRDEHYDRSGSLPDQNILELIKQREDISGFARLIQIAGYDSLLSATQTYTVWAPVNESFSDLNLNTISREDAKLIVENHIARFNNSSSSSGEKLIRMINAKIYTFSGAGSSFGGTDLLNKDVLAKNGILHTINSRIPYRYNLYEYINSFPESSYLSEFILSFDEELFDEGRSVPIDIDENGRTVYDTVTTPYNRLFDHTLFGLGSINSEDSVFSMIVPNNAAWLEAYERIFPYFKVYNANAAYADSVRKVQTSLAIINDLIYRERLENPALFDSIISTSGSVIHDPADLFLGTTKIEASNGLIYATGNLRYNNVETWNKNIDVEGEYTFGRVTGSSTTIYTRYVDNEEEIYVSEGSYIEVQPTSTSSQPYVTFQIPNVLSGKYDIYVEFIPASIDGTPNDSTKLMFTLTYLNASGRTDTRRVESSEFVTSGTKRVKMKVLSGFEFPVSNYYDQLWLMDYEKGLHGIDEYVFITNLMVRTNVLSSEFSNNIFTRKFRVDRIIFEAVRN
jgi:hypothetical protein